MKVYPWGEVLANAERKMQDGYDVYQQFNCERCRTKQTIMTPNIFHRTGQCEECQHVTDIEKAGMNFMMTSIGLIKR
jgi:hypothetical protein